MTYNTQYNSETRTWSGNPKKSIYNPDINIAQPLFASLEHNPEHIGQINDNSGRQLTNGQIRLNAIRLALNMQRGHLAVHKNDAISVVSKNHELLSAVVLAAFALAAPINPLAPTFREDELAHMFGLTKPKIVFCESDNIACVRKALRSLSMESTTKLVTVDQKVVDVDAVEDLLEPHADEDQFIPADIEDGTKHTAVILCTSGTTGLPKGVMIPHAMLISHFYSIAFLLASDVYFTFTPIYWISGLYALVGGTLAGVTRIITTQSFDPDLMVRLVEKYSVTVIQNAPYQLALLLQCPSFHTANWTSVRRFYIGGSAVANDLKDKISKKLPSDLWVMYGLSETAGRIAVNETQYKDSVGKLSSDVRVQIVTDEGLRLGPNEKGEIYIKPAIRFTGYISNEIATADALDNDGWFRTGDVGYFDEQGYLFVVDRKKDIIKYQNWQISPTELENIINGCDGVASVCVVGIPDAVSIDLPAAVILKAVGKEVNSEDIKALIKDQLCDAKQLRGGVYFVDDLPLTASGKVLRRRVKEIAIEEYKKQNAS